MTRNQPQKAVIQEESQDMRSFPRYQVRNGSALLLMPGNIVSHSLLDVSKSGLSFCYYGKSIDIRESNGAEVTLFAENAILSDISITVISDTLINTEFVGDPTNNMLSELLQLRRCGVKFTLLSEDIEDLLADHWA